MTGSFTTVWLVISNHIHAGVQQCLLLQPPTPPQPPPYVAFRAVDLINISVHVCLLGGISSQSRILVAAITICYT